MTETTHVRIYESDKKKIAELADEHRAWPAKIQQIVSEAEQ